MTFQEDNNGFIQFPYGNLVSITENEKTLIYLVAFEPRKPGIISNVNITLPGDFVADDVIDRVSSKDDVVDNLSIQSQYDNIYFPNDEDDDIFWGTWGVLIGIAGFYGLIGGAGYLSELYDNYKSKK